MLKLFVRTERHLLTPSGGNRYLDIHVRRGDEPQPYDLVLAVDSALLSAARRDWLLSAVKDVLGSVPPGARVACVAFGTRTETLRYLSPVNVDDILERLSRVPCSLGGDWREGWLRACQAVAEGHLPQRPQHCLLMSEGPPAANWPGLAEQAAGVSEHAWIATSVLVPPDSPNRSRLARLARRGGGYLLVRPPYTLDVLARTVGRVVIEIQTPVRLNVLGRVRGAARQGNTTLVEPIGSHTLLTVRFPAGVANPILKLRASYRHGGETLWTDWQTLKYEIAERPELADSRVMRRVGRELARVARRVAAPKDRELRPGDSGDGAGTLVGRFVPSRAEWPFVLAEAVDRQKLHDAVRGCLLWGAVASAMGKGLEGLDPATIRSRYGAQGVQHLEPWFPGMPESAGMVSGDVQVLTAVGETVLAGQGQLDPEDFCVRLVKLLPVNRGIGNAAVEAGHALLQGERWYQAGLAANSAGNGAAMRVAPVGVAWSLDNHLLRLYRDAVLSALPTHTHPIGVSAAVVMAAAVGQCLRLKLSGRALVPQELLHFLAELILPIEGDPVRERRPRGGLVRFSDRLEEVGRLLSRPPDEAFNVLWNGSFALESVPAALYCFLRTPEDPRQTVLVAINAGFDADTVGGMAAQLAGVWNGLTSLITLQPTWWAGLEARSDFLRLADGLAEVAWSRRPG